jgi:hypothetical protein
MLQLEAYLTIVIHDRKTFIVQATCGYPIKPFRIQLYQLDRFIIVNDFFLSTETV